MQMALARNDVIRESLFDGLSHRSKKYKPTIDSASDGVSGIKHRLAMIPSGAKL